jgi:hypothetical protein
MLTATVFAVVALPAKADKAVSDASAATIREEEDHLFLVTEQNHSSSSSSPFRALSASSHFVMAPLFHNDSK